MSLFYFSTMNKMRVMGAGLRFSRKLHKLHHFKPSWLTLWAFVGLMLYLASQHEVNYWISYIDSYVEFNHGLKRTKIVC